MKMKGRILAIAAIALFVGSIILQFLYNMFMVVPYEPILTKGGDGKLTQMLYESENLEDSYFANSALISENLAGAIERIDVREDCADFTANAMIRFYL